MMQERRHTQRTRVLFGGIVAYNEPRATFDCVVHNFSEAGARIALHNPNWLPKRFDLLINRKGRAYLADVIWRSADEAGVSFRPADDAMMLDKERISMRKKAKRRALRARRAELSCGY